MDKIKDLLKDKKVKLGLVSLVLFIIVFILISKLGRDGIVLKSEDDYTQENILSQVDKIERGEDNKFGIYNNYLYKWANGKIFLRSLDQPGESYNLSLNIGSPLIVPGDKYLFVSNPEEGIIYYINSKAEMVERIPLNQPIFSFKEENDNIIYHTKARDKENLGIIDSDLNNLMKYDYDQESILQYSYYPSKKKVAVGILNVDEKSIGTRLDLYEDLTNKETMYFDKEIIIGLEYINLGNLLVLTDNNLYYISENEVVWQKDMPLAKDLMIDGNKIYGLYGNHLVELDTSGEEKKNLTLSNQYSRLEVLKGKMFSQDIIVYNEAELAIIRKDQEELIHNQDILELDTWKDTIFILDKSIYGFYKEANKEASKEVDKK